MYFAIFPDRDATITNATVKSISHTSSNSGLSEIVELYVLSESMADRGKSRILMHFDLSPVSSSIAAGLIPTSSVQFNLKLKNSNHYETIPVDYYVQIYPLTTSWTEGVGLAMYDEGLKDNGIVNWNQATSLVNWTTAGGDIDSTLSRSFYFADGSEDLNVDISNIVYSWLTGGMANNGIMIKFLDFYETGSNDLYVKKFYSRHAHRPDRVPKLEAVWQTNVLDDRANMAYNISGNLYYYRSIYGNQLNAPSELYMRIYNSSSTQVQALTASTIGTGIYQASGAFVTHTSSTQIYRDVWLDSQGNQYFTGTFTPVFMTGSDYFHYDDVDVVIPNLKPEYDRYQKVTIRVVGKEKDYKPAMRSYSSVGLTPILLRNAYYRIEHLQTEDVVVDFSTGSLQYSRLSYDENGNWFNMWTDSFTKDSAYKIKILVNYNGQATIFDKNWTFKIKK